MDSSDETAGHVMLFAGFNEKIPQVVHAIGEPHSSIMVTQLNLPDEACSYRIFRLKDQLLAIRTFIK